MTHADRQVAGPGPDPESSPIADAEPGPTPGAGSDSGAGSTPGESRPRHGTKLTSDVQAAETALTTWLRGRPRLAAVVAAVSGVVIKQSYYRLSLSAAGAAFWLVIAIFPAVFAAIMIFGLVVSQEQITDWLDRASRTSSEGLPSVVAEQAQQVVQTEPSTLSVGLLISLALTLWSASAGAYALLKSLRLAYGLAPQPYLTARARGVVATLVAVVALGALVWAAVQTRRWVLGMDGALGFLVGVGAALLALLFVTALVAATFRFAIAMPTPRRCVLPATVLTVLAFGLLITAAALFGSYASRFQATYGALTSVVVTLLALYALMYATLLAALFNALWAPLPAHETAMAAPPDEQWQRLSAALGDSTAGHGDVSGEPPSGTLP